MRRIFTILPALLLFTGCAHVAQPVGLSHSEIKQINEKNYILGEKRVAYTGEPVVIVKDYHVSESASWLKADRAFTITGGCPLQTYMFLVLRDKSFPLWVL